MDAQECFDYSTVESLPDFDQQPITMDSILSCGDYMSTNTIEAVRFNESMNAMDFASSSTMFDLKHFGGSVNIAD